MRHSWILDVLSDLQSYAELNNLPAIAVAAKQTLGIAEVEIAPLHGDVAEPQPSGGPAD